MPATKRQRLSLPKGLPLRDLRGTRIEKVETGENWFRVVAKGQLRARVTHPADAVLCRLGAPLGEDVVQLAIGRPRSLLANALFSPQDDLGIEFRGKELRLDWDRKSQGYAVTCTNSLEIVLCPHLYRDRQGLKWYKPMDRREFDRAPAGWCSWYCYGLNIDEKEVLANARWLRERLAPFGLKIVQIDDGWQGRGTGFGGNRDWFVTAAKFPQGMKWLAGEIRRMGLVPGIWLIPFTQSDPALHARNRRLFVHGDDGRSIGERDSALPYAWMPEDERYFEWMGRYVLDPTGTTAQAYLKRLFRMICVQWGYDYVKIDAQGGMADCYRRHRPRLANPQMDGDAAYRTGLAAIRKVMGRKRFLLNCGAGWDSAGLCEGIRIGGDVAASYEGLQNAVDCTMQHLYLNRTVWWTDPDVVCVRPPLSLDQARAWATLLGITGQLLMASDDMPRLAEDRVELLRRIFPVADIRPMELYPLRNRPGVFDLKINKPGVGDWDVVAVFNWNRSWARTGKISASALGIPPCPRGFVFYDVWDEKVLAVGTQDVEIQVAPTSCRVISVHAVESRPQAIATSRHLTQGADDLENVRWNAKSATLSGTSQVVAGDPYRLRFTVPAPWIVKTPGIKVAGRVGLLVLRSARNSAVRWTVQFRR